jgi:hypothetical protein
MDQGQGGWHLYNALVYSVPRDGVTDEQRIDYARTAEAMRDEALEMAGLRKSGWGNADIHKLEFSEVPHAARVLFTLPGANRC